MATEFKLPGVSSSSIIPLTSINNDNNINIIIIIIIIIIDFTVQDKK